MPSTVCTAKVSYKKLSGLLELNSTHLQWTQDGKKAPTVRVPYSDAASLFCSKEGSAQVRLKLGLVGDDAGHGFTFTAPQPVALVEREKFKSELTNIISRNRSGATTPAVLTPGAPIIAASSGAPTPRPPIPAAVASTSRAASISRDSRASGTPVNDPTSDFRLRKKVLVSTPELAALHRELVLGGHITEQEFWDGREHLLLAQAASESQRRGKPGQIIDPRPQTVEGETKMMVTPQIIHDIFEEYPVVAKAYNDVVPNKLTEEDFWQRYFQSKLFNAHRASIRSSATQFVVKDDPIFDKYLEKDDDELEPRRQREGRVDIFIDLNATLEDHDETGPTKDVTMQAGKQRAVLPLIRKFNEHSGRLLDTALGDPAPKRRRIGGNDTTDHIQQLDLEDLHDSQKSVGILLDMQDRQRYFDGRVSNVSAHSTQNAIDVRAAIFEAKNSMHDWVSSLGQLKLDRKAADSAVSGMTQNVAARLDVKMKKHDIPEGLFRQLTSCQTAANEFLRQFWLSIYPPPTETQTLSQASSAQKAAKAAKMIGYLGKTHEKVDALVRTAQTEGVDPTRVQIAMQPVLNAVDRALAFWQAKNSNNIPGVMTLLGADQVFSTIRHFGIYSVLTDSGFLKADPRVLGLYISCNSHNRIYCRPTLAILVSFDSRVKQKVAVPEGALFIVIRDSTLRPEASTEFAHKHFVAPYVCIDGKAFHPTDQASFAPRFYQDTHVLLFDTLPLCRADGQAYIYHALGKWRDIRVNRKPKKA